MKFEIGDVVRIISDEYSGHEFPIGTLVRLIRLHNDGDYFYAEYLDKHDWWAVNTMEIKPV